MLIVLTSQKAIVPYRAKLKTIVSRFEDLAWSTIPHVDLFIAFYSLTRKLVENFDAVWNHIRVPIKPGGFFMGDFSPYSKAEAVRLLEGFEILYIDKINALESSDDEDADQEFPAEFSAIARKK